MSECLFYCDGGLGPVGFTFLGLIALICVATVALQVADGSDFGEAIFMAGIITVVSSAFFVATAFVLVVIPELAIVATIFFGLCLIGWGIGKVLQ